MFNWKELYIEARALRTRTLDTIKEQIEAGVETMTPSEIVLMLQALSTTIEAQHEVIRTLVTHIGATEN